MGLFSFIFERRRNMNIEFVLEDHEENITPLRTAEAIVSSEFFSVKDLKEIIAYLSVYTRYNNTISK